ncbi:MAG TPA: 50S ribosomal protein L15 [Chthonomonadales bacterium]|nr:50S ribosomal protein L15 [Chthonomonadales bacterium]
MGIHNLKPAAGSKSRSKRVGRGIGSGHGKTSGRGHKGNKARGQINPNFEGGQTPLHRRLPERRGVGKRNPHGFKNLRHTDMVLVNVGLLEARFEAGAEVSPESLLAKRVIREVRDGVKILGDGELTKKLTVKAHGFSRSAVQKLESAGGSAEVLEGMKR